ncbi:MAG: ABC transporter ATP-binding protein [Candidatus Thermoplasmatota archaeon]
MKTYLEVEGLGNTIDGFTLKDISFEVCEGEIVLLGGGNGAGKTSLLETLCFVEKPTEGRINFFDKQVFDGSLKKKDLRDIKTHIGVQFQGDSLFKNLTVKETFKLFFENYEFDDLSEVIFGCPFLEDVLEKRISKLSKGKSQLVKFILSIINDPKMVFLDEPVSTLDGDSRRWVYEKIKEMRSEGTSFLITLNDMWTIGDISNRLITLVDGGIYDVVDDFFDYYKGSLVKIPIEEDIDEIRDKAWVLKIVQEDEYYKVYSELSIKSIIGNKEIPYFEVRNVKLRDFSPG